MKVVILAAGEGSRLLPLTLEIPKPLIPIQNKLIIERIFEALPGEIDEVVMVVEYLKDKLKSHLGENFQGRKVTYVDQGESKGTYGALLSAKHLFKRGERFLVLNGDDMHSKEELSVFMSVERGLGIQKMCMPNYYQTLVSPDGFVAGFRQQTAEEKIEGAWVATGVYLIDSSIFDHSGVLVNGGELGLPQTIMAQRELYPIKAIRMTGWVPVNSFSDIEKANKLFENQSRRHA